MRQYRKCVNFYLHEIAKGTPLPEIYQKAKQQYNLQTGLIQTARDIAKEQYDSYKNNPDNPHFPHFKGMMTTRFDHRSISFKQSDGHFSMWANISTVNGKIKVPITSCPEYIDFLKNNKFKCVQLKYSEGDYYLNVIFEEEKKIPKNFDYIIGVDRGSHNNIATVVVQDKYNNYIESKFYPTGKAVEKHRRYRELRKQFGRKKLWAMLKKTKNRERNYMMDVNRKISTDIIKIAKQYQNAVIVLENLSKIRGNSQAKKWSRKNKWLLHLWSFKELEDMIEYKAHGNSIALRRVYPRGTSSTCKDCDGKMKRSPSIIAVCKSCKKVYNADWLGAFNIGRRLSYMLSHLGVSESRPKQGTVESKGVATASGFFGSPATSCG